MLSPWKQCSAPQYNAQNPKLLFDPPSQYSAPKNAVQPPKMVLSPPKWYLTPKPVLSLLKQGLTTEPVLSPPKRLSPNEGITHHEVLGAGTAPPHPLEHPWVQGQVWAPRRGIVPRASPALGQQGGEGTRTPGSLLSGLRCSPQRGPLQFPHSTHTGHIVLQKGRTAQAGGVSQLYSPQFPLPWFQHLSLPSPK